MPLTYNVYCLFRFVLKFYDGFSWIRVQFNFFVFIAVISLKIDIAQLVRFLEINS